MPSMLLTLIYLAGWPGNTVLHAFSILGTNFTSILKKQGWFLCFWYTFCNNLTGYLKDMGFPSPIR